MEVEIYKGLVLGFGVVVLLSLFPAMERQELVLGQPKVRMNYLFTFMMLAVLVYVTAHRGYIADTRAYLKQYSSIPLNLESFRDYLSLQKDKGFVILTWLIKRIVGDQTILYLGTIATMQFCLLLSIYRKYSESLVISLFLFIFSTDYMSWALNGMRQFLAATIIFLCLPFILKKHHIWIILLIALASTFHGSAWLVLPIIFIVQGPAFNRKTILILIASFGVIAVADQFTNILDVVLGDTQYTNVVSDWQGMQDDGTNVLRVLVYSVPVIVAFIQKKVIAEVNNPLINLCVNMSIVGVGLYIVSMFTSGIYIGRLPIYFTLYNYILLPWELKYLFSRGSDTFMNICMMLGYFLFCGIQLGLLLGGMG